MSKALVVLLLLVGLAVVATPTAAKEGIVAKVRVPVSRDAEPGTKVTMVWELTSVESGRASPFSADNVFMRLFGREGSRSRRAYGSRSSAVAIALRLASRAEASIAWWSASWAGTSTVRRP